MRIQFTALIGLAAGLWVCPAMAYPPDKVEHYRFPDALGSVYKELYDYSGPRNLVAVLVTDVTNPTSWVVAQMRDTQYAQTTLSEPVQSVFLTSSGAIAATSTASGARVYGLSNSGQIVWTLDIGPATASVSVDRNVVSVSNHREGEESFPTGYVNLYSADAGSPLAQLSFSEPLTGAFAIDQNTVVVSHPNRVKKLVAGAELWSISFQEEVMRIIPLGSDHIAVLHPMGRTRVYTQTGTLFFDFNPTTLAPLLPPLTEGFLRQLKPFPVSFNKVIFFDSLHLAGTVVELDLVTAQVSQRQWTVYYPANFRPSRRLYEGRVGWVHKNRLIFLDIR